MKIVCATHNAHKLEEISAQIGGLHTIVSLADIGCFEDIPESHDTFEGNALEKARYVKEHYGYDCFADDSGLEVDALGGRPGVYSARYAGVDKDSEKNIDKLLQELQDLEESATTDRGSASQGFTTDAGDTPHGSDDEATAMRESARAVSGVISRRARFRTAIALVTEEGEHIFEGAIEGEILHERHGSGGFGYDPIFRPEGYDVTFAEMAAEEKNRVSHRAIAVKKLCDFLKSKNQPASTPTPANSNHEEPTSSTSEATNSATPKPTSAKPASLHSESSTETLKTN